MFYRQSNAKHLLIFNRKVQLTVSGAVHLCLIYTSCMPAAARGGEGEGMIDGEIKKDRKTKATLTSCLNYPDMYGTIISPSDRNRPFGIQPAITVQFDKHNSWAAGIMLLVTVMRRGRKTLGGGVHGLMRNKGSATKSLFLFLLTEDLMPDTHAFVFPSFVFNSVSN